MKKEKKSQREIKRDVSEEAGHLHESVKNIRFSRRIRDLKPQGRIEAGQKPFHWWPSIQTRQAQKRIIFPFLSSPIIRTGKTDFTDYKITPTNKYNKGLVPLLSFQREMWFPCHWEDEILLRSRLALVLFASAESAHLVSHDGWVGLGDAEVVLVSWNHSPHGLRCLTLGLFKASKHRSLAWLGLQAAFSLRHLLIRHTFP